MQGKNKQLLRRVSTSVGFGCGVTSDVILGSPGSVHDVVKETRAVPVAAGDELLDALRRSARSRGSR